MASLIYEEASKLLTIRLIKQGFKYDHLCFTFKKFTSKDRDIFNKTLK